MVKTPAHGKTNLFAEEFIRLPAWFHHLDALQLIVLITSIISVMRLQILNELYTVFH